MKPPLPDVLRRCPALLVCVTLAVLAGPLPVVADTVEVQAVRDNTLFKDSEGAVSSGSGPHFFAGNNSGSNTRRGVVMFDVAAHVPAGATIDSVALVLHISSAPNDTPQSISVHRLLADWGEGASSSSGGAGDTTEVGDASWIHTFYPSQFWSTEGGDFVGAASDVQTVAPTGVHVWTGPTMVADVQLWIDQPETAFGWLLKGIETGAATVRRIDSREHSTAANHPYLFIAYTTDTTGVEETSWGALKARYSTPPPSAAAPGAPDDAASREDP